MRLHIAALGVAVCLIVAASALPQQPADPIIGIITEPPAFGVCVSAEWHHHKNQLFRDLRAGRVNPSELLSKANRKPMAHGQEFGDPTMPPHGNFSGCVWSIYVNWLQMSGIRVIPVPWNSPKKTLDWYFERVNGFFFPGGILSGKKEYVGEYFPTVQYIFDKTVAANNKGDGMVMWGTCQGFELINAAAAGYLSAVQSGFVGVDPKMCANNLTTDGSSSRMWGKAPADVVSFLTKNASTLNWHSKGVTPAEYKSSSLYDIGKYLRALTTTNDANGRTFVSSFEGVEGLNIFGVQFHPERPVFEFDNDKITHGLDAIQVSQYLSRFLVSQLRQNNHRFDTPLQAEKEMIANYPLHNDGWGIGVYYI